MAGYALTRESVRVLDEDPDLARALSAADRREAADAAVAPLEPLPAGSHLGGRLRDEPGSLGYLVLDGLIVREVTVEGATFGELIGPGEVLRPRDTLSDEQLVRYDVDCRVVEDARLAFLDRAFASAAGRWPELAAALLERVSRRAGRLSVHQAVTHITRVDTRLLVALWLLSETFGRVTADGVLLTVKLSHRSLGDLVGAQRPTVTKALKELAERGLIDRRPDGRIVLAAARVEELGR